MEEKQESFRKVVPIINGERTEDLDCPICKEVFDNPRVFSKCQHTFCFQCIRGHINNAITQMDSTFINCPVCRTQLDQTVETFKDKPAHDWMDFFPKNIGLANVVSNLKTDAEYCEKHRTKLLDYFCEDHNALCCSSCILALHRHCERVTELDDFAKDYSKDKVYDIVSTCIDKISLDTAELDKKQGLTKKNAETTISYLKNRKMKINQELDRLERNVNTTTQTKAKYFENKKTELVKMKETLLSKCDTIETPQDFVFLLHEITAEEKELKLFEKTVEAEDFSQIRNELSKNVKSILNIEQDRMNQQRYRQQGLSLNRGFGRSASLRGPCRGGILQLSTPSQP